MTEEDDDKEFRELLEARIKVANDCLGEGNRILEEIDKSENEFFLEYIADFSKRLF